MAKQPLSRHSKPTQAATQENQQAANSTKAEIGDAPVYELVNFSDPYTLKSAHLDAATLACLFLGNGKYVLKDRTGNHMLPFFFGPGAKEWFKGQFGSTIEVWMAEKSNLRNLISALRSVLIGSISDREEFELAVAKMSESDAKKFEAKRHEKRCSSLNDIGSYAKSLAESLEDGSEVANGQ